MYSICLIDHCALLPRHIQTFVEAALTASSAGRPLASVGSYEQLNPW